jgi:hypothetical protein
MIKVESLAEAVRIAYQSVYVKGETPLSLLLIADTDSGKSNLILNYIPKVEHLCVEKLTDASAMGIYRCIKDKVDPVTLVIPDFHAIVSHKASVTEATINALMSLLQDGVMKVSVGPSEAVELKGKRANVITAMTPGILQGKAGKWRKLGFMRRLLPIHYTYSSATTKLIHDSIRAQEYHKPIKEFTLTVTTPKTVAVPTSISQDIQNLATVASATLENRGFTCHKFFRVFAQARALSKNRTSVTNDDLQALADFSQFCNLDVPVQL